MRSDRPRDEADFLAMLTPTQEPRDVARFLEALAVWLRERDDPRLVEGEDGSTRIDDLVGCAAEFCQHMAEVTETGARS